MPPQSTKNEDVRPDLRSRSPHDHTASHRRKRRTRAAVSPEPIIQIAHAVAASPVRRGGLACSRRSVTTGDARGTAARTGLALARGSAPTPWWPARRDDDRCRNCSRPPPRGKLSDHARCCASGTGSATQPGRRSPRRSPSAPQEIMDWDPAARIACAGSKQCLPDRPTPRPRPSTSPRTDGYSTSGGQGHGRCATARHHHHRATSSASGGR